MGQENGARASRQARKIADSGFDEARAILSDMRSGTLTLGMLWKTLESLCAPLRSKSLTRRASGRPPLGTIPPHCTSALAHRYDDMLHVRGSPAQAFVPRSYIWQIWSL